MRTRKWQASSGALAGVSAMLCVAFVPVEAWGAEPAGNPLNSDEKPPSSDIPPPTQGKNEFTLVPAAGGSTDIGVAVGYFTALTRTEKGYVPYLWNLESAGLVSFGLKNGAVDVPYVDVYGKLTVPRFLDHPIDLEIRPSFTDEQILYYYGMGNASSASPPSGQSTTYFQYSRIHPSLLADVRFKVVDHVAAITGMRYTGSWFDVPSGSKLSQDIQTGSAEVRGLIGPTSPTQVGLFIYGLQVDTRDSEVTPHSGTFDEATIKLSPGDNPTLPFRYGEASLNLRAYVPLSRRVTLAGRIIGDVLFGDPPFAELPRFEDTYAVGGSNGVRGVPAQRYYGKVKIIGNVELRVRVFDFHALSKPMSLGFETFFDGGRVWADTSPHPELDGTGFGLKYGIGGGVRLTSGSAFVLRADVAWSPDAMPIGAYVSAGEMF
jgi:outer membrane protein assembly factor BamA